MAKIITPVITVFDKDEKPDLEGNKKVIDFLIKNGVDGILVLGSAGEFPNLSVQESKEFFQFYADYTAGRTELFAGTGCMNYQDTRMLTNAAYHMGFRSSMVITPYYYALDQEKIFMYYDRLASEVEGDFYLYNFPARSGNSIGAETIRRLLETHSNIIGLKDSVTEPGHTNDVFRILKNSKFQVFSGFDDQFLLNVANHGGGCIGALSNIVPDIWSDLVKSESKRDFKRTLFLTGLIQKLMPIYDMDSNPAILLKKLMIHRGVSISETEVFPFNQIDPAIYSKAESLMDSVLRQYQENADQL